MPRVMDREANMSMLCVSTLSDLVVNSMGIVEPDFNYPDGNPRKNGEIFAPQMVHSHALLVLCHQWPLFGPVF